LLGLLLGLPDWLGMGAEQRQQQRDFFLRTDLDHDDLLFAPLVGLKGEGVQNIMVSGLFQNCFVVGTGRISPN
jgi:hypothetical protein